MQQKSIKTTANYFHDINYDILIWNKSNPTPLVKNKYLSDVEYIIYAREKGVPLYGDFHSKRKVITQPIEKNNFDHPTVKPLNIITTLMLNSTLQNEIVLDPYAGTGTTAVACEMNNRKWVAIEVNKYYCEIIIKRLESEAKQRGLFN